MDCWKENTKKAGGRINWTYATARVRRNSMIADKKNPVTWNASLLHNVLGQISLLFIGSQRLDKL